VKLGNLCDVVRGSSPRPKEDPRFYGGSVPRLMVADLTRDGRLATPRIDSLTEEGANFFDFGINGCRKYGSTIFGRANDVIHQNRNIMLFMNELAHSHIIKPQQADGVLNPS